MFDHRFLLLTALLLFFSHVSPAVSSAGTLHMSCHGEDGTAIDAITEEYPDKLIVRGIHMSLISSIDLWPDKVNLTYSIDFTDLLARVSEQADRISIVFPDGMEHEVIVCFLPEYHPDMPADVPE